ncbi:hypothetical protein RM550_26205 [Streptomyces sp. DSM 41527]|uniref:Uncharacterized protein n=1 Tax=Streptomyces mooreae TaxID=3075523 RepID=A0ABU2TDZ5_9ACTN|nr:hypothetical protein [Streptomyces sp. DSM 41527]MDT0459168.1 hypothetical protein [Streptomyces sp. DSM 41527]
MELLPHGLTWALYLVTVLSGIGLLIIWVSSVRSRRNAGFASKGQLRRHLSAKTVVRAAEIRPSLARDGSDARLAAGVNLIKGRSARS